MKRPTDRAREAYFEWSTGHGPETTLREYLRDELNVPSEEWNALLKDKDVHPRVLDMTYNEACEAPDSTLTFPEDER